MKRLAKPGVRTALLEYKEVQGGLVVRRLSDMTNLSNERVILGLTEQQLKDWCNPANPSPLIQKIMPHLAKADREFLISGITPEEWERIEEQEE